MRKEMKMTWFGYQCWCLGSFVVSAYLFVIDLLYNEPMWKAVPMFWLTWFIMCILFFPWFGILLFFQREK